MEKNAGGLDNNMILLPTDQDLVKYYKQALQVSVHHFYIVDEIVNASPYLDMINVLKTAEQHDTVFIYLNTPGGNLYTAMQIISAIRQSNATVVTSLEGMVASAGTLLFLAGHKHVVNQNCTFMIHNYSHGIWGKGNEVALQVRHSENYFRKLATDMYGNFLTEQEIEDLINGKDFWMESEEVLERLGTENSASSINALMDSLSSDKGSDEDGPSDEEVLEAMLETAKAVLESEAKPKAKPKAKKKPVKKKVEA